MKTLLLAAVACIALSSPADAYRRNIEVVDGDTLRLTGGGELSGRYVRIVGLDTPEINGKCAYEINQAWLARERLVQLLEGGAIFQTDFQTDLYKRFIAKVFNRHGENVADMLIAEGLARPYDGRTKREPWC